MPEGSVIAAAVFGLFMLYVLSRIFYQPLKVLLRAAVHLVAGGLVIVVYNLAGATWNLAVGLNLVSALTVGIMGIPGLLMLIALRQILG